VADIDVKTILLDGQVLGRTGADLASVPLPPGPPGPAVYAGVYRSAVLSIPTGALDIAWDAEDEDTFGFHNNTVNPERLTVPTGYGGLYMVGGTIIMSTVGSTTKLMSVYITKNGTALRTGEGAIDMPTYVPPSITTVGTVRLAVGDYLILGCYQNNVAMTMDRNKSGFWCYRIGT
jgi:hypothetical protein